MKKMILTGLSVWFMLAAQLVQAEPVKVATTLPVTHALTQALLADTGIEAVYLPPTRLPVKRIANWLENKSDSRIDELGPFQALVTIESVWPRYALYGKLRSRNIYLVPVDVARELNQPGLQVRQPVDAGDEQYFWLAPDNLQVMGQILARDLARLWPQQRDRIRLNQQRLNQQIQSYMLAVDELLISHDVTAVCLQHKALMPQAEAMFLPVELRAECPADELALTKQKRGASPEPGLWLLNPADKLLSDGVQGWLDGNLARLRLSLSEA